MKNRIILIIFILLPLLFFISVLLSWYSKKSTAQFGVLGDSIKLRNPPLRPAIEWLSEEEFVIYRSCGTECEGTYIFDLQNFKKKLYYGVDHTWSPDKNYVFAYHYTFPVGITVGDRFGNRLFTIRRTPGHFLPKAISLPKASWAPDSSRLALIIDKEKSDILELLVFSVNDNFKTILQKDLENNQLRNLGWVGNSKIFYELEGMYFETPVVF